MYSNNEFGYGISKTAKVIKMDTEEVVKTINVELPQELLENSSFVGSGVGSGGRNLIAYTLDDMSGIECGLYQIEVDEVVYVLTSKQTLPLRRERRYSIKKPTQQTTLVLE